MNMTEVKSSQIHSIGHEGTTLAVLFHGGALYHYFDCPSTAHADLLKADSIGKHFAKHVKGTFKYLHVNKPEKK